MRRLRFLGIAAIPALAAAWLAAGVVVVAPGEAVVVRRLGRALEPPWRQGPHWAFPLGIDRLDRVRLDRVRRLEVGLAGVPGAADEPGTGEYLTGDRNLVKVRAVVQYRVADPIGYTLRADAVDALLGRLAEADLAASLSKLKIDDVLGAGRVALAEEVRASLRRDADRHGLGVAILAISLTDARPPREVEPDFVAAQSARSERDRLVRDARTYEATTLAAARAEADARQEAAHAVADRARTEAEARAGRFLDLLDAAARDRPLTVRRLYRDALRDLLPRVRRTLVLAPDEPLDLSILGDDPAGSQTEPD